MILGSLLLIFAHLALSVFNSVTLGYLGLLSLGIAFSLVPAAMWPSVAKIVAESTSGDSLCDHVYHTELGTRTLFLGHWCRA